MHKVNNARLRCLNTCIKLTEFFETQKSIHDYFYGRLYFSFLWQFKPIFNRISTVKCCKFCWIIRNFHFIGHLHFVNLGFICQPQSCNYALCQFKTAINSIIIYGTDLHCQQLAFIARLRGLNTCIKSSEFFKHQNPFLFIFIYITIRTFKP
jgi:hypothetical protein